MINVFELFPDQAMECPYCGEGAHSFDALIEHFDGCVTTICKEEFI